MEDNRNMIDKMLDASFGDNTSEQIHVSFKKTTLVRSYETEVFEASNDVTFDHPLNNAERMFIEAVLKAQLEYTCYTNLLNNGTVTNTEFNVFQTNLCNTLLAIKARAEEVSGISMDKYLKDTRLTANQQ